MLPELPGTCAANIALIKVQEPHRLTTVYLCRLVLPAGMTRGLAKSTHVSLILTGICRPTMLHSTIQNCAEMAP